MLTPTRAVVSILLFFLLNPTEASYCRRPPRLVTINPPEIFDPEPLGYSHIAVDTKNNVATVAGQVAIDVNGSIVGTTLAEQLAETERSLNFVLNAVDADVEDIFKLNAYITNFDPSTDLATFQPTGMRLGSPPSTLISVPSLALDGLLVEIEISVAVSERFIRKLSCNRRYWK